ncbi:hypothetical protein Fcan01_01012 [Folsomia candida]|uniref:Uncharacterized protein n=2 Tax=Folsomia candida TaxID=158441 RepID=A0A226EYT2_FOLCA|nr:hypothetical protein Fcan01_01012 [Folsomia candida]
MWEKVYECFMLALFWRATFWNRKIQPVLCKILEYQPKRKTSQEENLIRSSVVTILLLIFGVIIPVAIELAEIFNVDGPDRADNYTANFRLSSAQVLFDLLLVRNHTHISEEDFTPTYFTISVVYMILRTWGRVLLGMANMLSLTTAITCLFEVKQTYNYSVTTNFTNKMIIEKYLGLSEFVKCMNKVNRSILLCLISASVPLMVLRVIHAWDTSQVFLKASFFVQLVQLVGILFISAEVGDKGTLLKTKMLELCKDEELKCWSDKIFRSELDIEADRFVNISYSFVGSLFSAYLAYAIMLLQINPCHSWN